jgi:DNA uptake protein ComE-like DNA-binding protein
MSRIKTITALTAALALAASLAYAQGGTATQAAKPAAPAKTTASSSTAKKSSSASMKVDLNKASKEDLMKVPGVDDATADKIIAARPFKSRSELESKGILTKEQYSKASSHITVKTSKSSKSASK